MDRVTDAPLQADLDAPVWKKWFHSVGKRFTIFSGTANPTAAQIPNGQWVVYKNTTIPEIRIWYNDNGTLKKSAAFT